MSNIHNLTSHLKNTTVTAAPSPNQPQVYRQTSNGLKIYQLAPPGEKGQQQQIMFPITSNAGGRKHVNIPSHLLGSSMTTPSGYFYHNQTAVIQQQAHYEEQPLIRKTPIQQQQHPQRFSHQQQQSAAAPNFTNSTAHVSSTKLGGTNHGHPHQKGYHPTIIRQPSPPKPARPQLNASLNSLTVSKNVPGPKKNSLQHNFTTTTLAGGQGQLQIQAIGAGGAARVVNVAQQMKNIIQNSSIPSDDVKKNGVKLQPKKIQQQVQMQIQKSTNPQAASKPSLPVVKSEEQKKMQNSGASRKKIERQPKSPSPVSKPFKKGDDVLFTTDDGTFMFGTVGMIHGENLQILFGDGTQQSASFDRVKLLSSSKDEEEANATEDKPKISLQETISRVPSGPSSGNSAPVNDDVTCGSCGVVKKVAGKKALNYAPHTKNQYNCRRCLNKQRFSKNNIPLMTSSPGKGKSSTSPNSTKNQTPLEHSRQSLAKNRDNCFHCEKPTNFNDRLHCNLCETACHLSCLAMTPKPLEGDRFWDVICSACGTQNGESGSSRTKVFSCRRSISSWSDVTHLVLSCLSNRPENLGERFFDLEKDVIPFIDKYLDRLHLPRAYKNVHPESRKTFLNTALTNATLRFLNGKDVNRKATLWAIRDTNSHQGYPMHRLQGTSSPKKLIQASQSTGSNAITPHKVANASSSSSKQSSPAGKVDASSRNVEIAKNPNQISPTKSKISLVTTTTTPTKSENDKSPPKDKSGNRLMSQTERLVQKAKRQCQLKRPTETVVEPTTNKRKSTSPFASQDSKRLKLSSESPKAMGIPPIKTLSPEQTKQMTEWLNNLNAVRNSPGTTPTSCTPPKKPTPPNMFGKAVKSAGITPPGNTALQQQKHSLRARKTKQLEFKSEELKKVEPLIIPKSALVKFKGRGRPNLKLKMISKNKHSQVPTLNGAPFCVEKEEKAGPEEFSLLTSSVQDLIKYGSSYTLKCLPKAAKTESETNALKVKAAELYKKEIIYPPAYLQTLNENGAKPKPWEKSKRDLKNLDSYDITAKWIDCNGTIRYYCEWKDGYGNDVSDGERNDDGPQLEFEADSEDTLDVDDPHALFEIGENLEVTAVADATTAKTTPTTNTNIDTDDMMDTADDSQSSLSVPVVVNGHCDKDERDNKDDAGSEEVTILESDETKVKLVSIKNIKIENDWGELGSGPRLAGGLSKTVKKTLHPFCISGLGLKKQETNILIDLTTDSP